MATTKLTLRDAAGERTIEAKWVGPIEADNLWIPHDNDFQVPTAVSAVVVRRRDLPWGSFLAVDLEIDGIRGAGLVTFTSDDDEGRAAVYVEPAPDGRNYYDDEETEIAALDSLKPLPEIAESGKWITSTGRSWIDATEYLASHPETKDWYYAKSAVTVDDVEAGKGDD